MYTRTNTRYTHHAHTHTMHTHIHTMYTYTLHTPRFAASKLIEGDRLILEQLKLDENEQETLEHIVLQMEKERGLDRSAAIADMRFAFIQNVCDECVTKPRVSKEHERSQKLDRILTGKYTALPMFILIMGLVFFLTFNVIGAWLQGLLEQGVGALTKAVDAALTAGGVNEAIHGLITPKIKSDTVSPSICH